MGLALYGRIKVVKIKADGEGVKGLERGWLAVKLKKLPRPWNTESVGVGRRRPSSSVICVHKTPRRLKPKPVEGNTISRSWIYFHLVTRKLRAAFIPYIPFYIVRIQVSMYILSLRWKENHARPLARPSAPYLGNCEEARHGAGILPGTWNWNVRYFVRLKIIWYYCSRKNGVITFRQ